jgi:uncharacterized protein YuzE
MTDTTYDPDADAVYIAIAPGRVAPKRRTGSLLYEFDAEGHIVGIEIRSASRILAPGDWQKARRPKASASRPTRGGSAQRFSFHQTVFAARRRITMINAAGYDHRGGNIAAARSRGQNSSNFAS